MKAEEPDCHEELFGLLRDLQQYADASPAHGALISEIKRELEEELMLTRNRSVAEFELQNQRLGLVISDARTRLALETEDRREREQRIADLSHSNKVIQAQIEDLERSLSSCPTATGKWDFALMKSEYLRSKARVQQLETELKHFEEREAQLLQMLQAAHFTASDDSLTMDLSSSEAGTERD